jgi:hypothetical protein
MFVNVNSCKWYWVSKGKKKFPGSLAISILLANSPAMVGPSVIFLFNQGRKRVSQQYDAESDPSSKGGYPSPPDIH